MAPALGQVKRCTRDKNVLGKPTWDIALWYPMQGDWTEDDFLAFESTSGNRMIELADGCLEVLPMPSLKHQRIVKWLLGKVDDFVVPRKLGETAMAPLPVRLFRGGIREPDIVFFEARRVLDADKRPLDGADLVMEVPSRGRKNRERDLQIKREEYARAKIPEYWIVDPETKTITVLTLSGKSYKVHGVYKPGEQAASKLLKGFKVAVSDVFAAGEGK
jgi:Uma2 family endonuclease